LARYDGPAFRVVRRFLNECPDPDLRILILSARFGLLEASDLVPDYDCKMTVGRARELAPLIDERLAALDAAGEHVWREDEYFALLGKHYLDLLAQCSCSLARSLIARNAPGGQGVKLAHLHRWLRMDANGVVTAAKPAFVQPDERSIRPIRFKGRDFTLAASDLARLVDRQVGILPDKATDSVWKAVVGGRHVALKWIVSLATGIPVTGFTTTEARRFLAQIGVEIIAP
jgi:hypothetical protein